MTAVGGGTVLRGAGATDIGNARSNNEDRYLLLPEQRLWVVADGMGGHRGGEVASQIACDTMIQTYSQNTVDGLVRAIRAANAAVYEAGNRDPDLAGMGTTVVGLAVVARDENEPAASDSAGPPETTSAEMLAVANVGDSRAYRFTDGDLRQLTEDHSLVADMVREGSLSQAEAESHPQRNIVTRALGVNDEVPVDVFSMPPRPGDRYLLCTDGLSDEVPVDRMAAVLRRLTDTHEAVDELLRIAVQGGARDNVTVVIVDVLNGNGDSGNLLAAGSEVGAEVDPGIGANIGSTASPTSSTTQSDSNESRAISGHAYSQPEISPTTGVLAPTDVATEPSGFEGAGGAEPIREMRPAGDADAPVSGEALEAEDAPVTRRGRRPRRFTWRVAAFLLLLLAVLGGAFGTIQWYGRSAYFVGFSGDEVAIYQGRPGGVLWIDPKLVETSSLQRDEVPPDALARLESGQQHASLDDAQDFVTRLEERAEDLQDSS